MSSSFVRNALGEYMTVLGEKSDRVVVVNADLTGSCRNRTFTERFPERSFNTGIAEQNLVSFSAGLACEGFIPYAFSMAPFLSMRACEQVRTDVAYGRRKVRLVGVYAGVSSGIYGATHWAMEDVGIMTAIPGIAVFEVSDPNQARRLLDYSLEYDGPMYIRCTVEATEDFCPEDIRVEAGGSQTVTEGNDGAILASGVIVQYAAAAAEKIRKDHGLHIRVVDMYSLKPLDREAVLAAAETGRIIVAQDHNVYGGLGSLVSTELAKAGLNPALRILGIPDRFVPMARAPYLYDKFGLNAGGIYGIMMEMMN